MHTNKSIILILLFIVTALLNAQAPFNYPSTRKTPKTKIYFGTSVQNEYSWLENTNDSAVQRWAKEQTQYASTFLKDQTYFKKLEQNLAKNDNYYLQIPASRKKYSFEIFRKNDYLSRSEKEKSVPALYYRYKNDLDWKELIDPATYKHNPTEIVSITHYEVSPDENYLLFFISRNGSDWQEIRIIDMHTRKVMKDVILWVKSSHIVWYKNGFFYKKYIQPTRGWEYLEKNDDEILRHHQLNTPESEDADTQIKNCIKVDLVAKNNLVIHSIKEIKGKTYYTVERLVLKDSVDLNRVPQLFIAQPFLTRYYADVLDIRNDSALMVNSFISGTGAVAFFNIERLNDFAIVVPSYKEVLTTTIYQNGKLHCLYRNDSSFMMVRFDLKGNREKVYDFGKNKTVFGFEYETEELVYYYKTSFDMPPVLFRFNCRSYESGLVNKTGIQFDMNEYEIKHFNYPSDDGVTVPLTVFYKKRLKINAETPLLLSAYGGYGITSNIQYNYAHLLWAESGGIYAFAHIRGGGEKGEKWHLAGKGKNKEQCITDFIKAAEFLIERGYTSPSKLAISGASHGGLIMAAALNKRPDLFKAAIVNVGQLDMLNYQDYTVGDKFSDEFGLSTDSVCFQTLLRYSPLHNIKKDVEYPAVLAITGDYDDRVPPFNSYKYVAAMQQNTTNKNPVLLHVNFNSGHQGGLTEKSGVSEKALWLSFLFKTLGMKPVFLY